MIVEILIILACVPLFAVNSFCDKYVSSKSKKQSGYLYNTFKFLIGSLLLLPIMLLDPLPKFSAGAIVCGTACGILYAVSKTVILKGYAESSVAFMTLCHSAGMILPCILGHFFWSEPLNALSIFGILLAVFSIVMLKDTGFDKKDLNLSAALIGLTVFISSGGVMVLQKLMGLYFADESISAYNFYSFAVAFIIICTFARREKEGKSNIRTKLLCAAGSAVSLLVISLVMTSLAGKVPSAILFPLFNGSGIISVCVLSAFLFKEKLTKKKSLGLITGIIGLCLVNL